VGTAVRSDDRRVSHAGRRQWDGMSMLRVVLIDDAELVRQAVAALIRSVGHEVVGEADDGATGVRETLDRRPDLVIVDWRMPGTDGVEATRRIRSALPSIAIVAFCSDDSPDVRDAFLQAGADVYVDKRDVKALRAALRAVAAGLHRDRVTGVGYR
jgi:DNA-binding NarL/FixJ family response regulator